MSADATLYEPIDGELHRHGARLTHAHPHAGPHVRDEPELHHDPGVAVVASAAAVAIRLPVADPLIGLAINAVILPITLQALGILGAPALDHHERGRVSLSFRRPR